MCVQLQAFRVIDKDGSGVLDLADITAAYDASKHPEVIAGKKTKAEVFREFIDNFDGGEKDGMVYPEEFERYYATISASIDDDDYFEVCWCACCLVGACSIVQLVSTLQGLARTRTLGSARALLPTPVALCGCYSLPSVPSCKTRYPPAHDPQRVAHQRW